MFFMTLFITLQFILLPFMLLHDLINIPPFNDVDALRKENSISGILLSALVNGTFVAIPLYLTLRSPNHSSWFIISCFYLVLTIGTICSWWIPYIFGSSATHKKHFDTFKNTHRFLPARGDNIIPNSLHVVLHLLVWSCYAISLYFYWKIY